MKWSIALSLVALLSAFLSIQATVIPVASGVPEEAVGRVVSVISGDALGVQMLISDPRTNNVESIKLADITSPSTVTPEGKAAQKYAHSLLWNKTVYLDIDDNTTSGRNEWSQLICVVYLMDSEYRPIWPPVNRIIVDAGYAKVNDDKKNEFNASTWWQEPNITEGSKENLLRDMAEEKAATSASSNNDNKNFDLLKDIAEKKIATNASSINNNRISDPLKDMAEKKAVTGGSVTVGDASKSSIMQKDSKTGRVSIGYRA